MRIAAAWMIFASWAIVLGDALPSAAGETRAAAEAVFHVSPDGSDNWSGKLPEPNGDRTDGPVASIDRARQAVRELRRAGGKPVPITVRVRGVHRLD